MSVSTMPNICIKRPPQTMQSPATHKVINVYKRFPLVFPLLKR